MATVLKLFLIVILAGFVLGVLKAVGGKLLEGFGFIVGKLLGSPIFWIVAIVLAIIWIIC